MRYPLLKWIPVRSGIVEDSAGQRQEHLAEEVVAAEHVAVPHGEPQRAVFQVRQRGGKLYKKKVQ